MKKDTHTHTYIYYQNCLYTLYTSAEQCRSAPRRCSDQLHACECLCTSHGGIASATFYLSALHLKQWSWWSMMPFNLSISTWVVRCSLACIPFECKYCSTSLETYWMNPDQNGCNQDIKKWRTFGPKLQYLFGRQIFAGNGKWEKTICSEC